jgi:hypothetical protein
MDRQPRPHSCDKHAGIEWQMSGRATRARGLFHGACDQTFLKSVAVYDIGLPSYREGVTYPASHDLHRADDARKELIQRVVTRHNLSADEVKYVITRSCIHVYSFVKCVRFLYSFLPIFVHIYY